MSGKETGGHHIAGRDDTAGGDGVELDLPLVRAHRAVPGTASVGSVSVAIAIEAVLDRHTVDAVAERSGSGSSATGAVGSLMIEDVDPVLLAVGDEQADHSSGSKAEISLPPSPEPLSAVPILLTIEMPGVASAATAGFTVASGASNAPIIEYQTQSPKHRDLLVALDLGRFVGEPPCTTSCTAAGRYERHRERGREANMAATVISTG